MKKIDYRYLSARMTQQLLDAEINKTDFSKLRKTDKDKKRQFQILTFYKYNKTKDKKGMGNYNNDRTQLSNEQYRKYKKRKKKFLFSGVSKLLSSGVGSKQP